MPTNDNVPGWGQNDWQAFKKVAAARFKLLEDVKEEEKFIPVDQKVVRTTDLPSAVEELNAAGYEVTQVVTVLVGSCAYLLATRKG